MGVTARVDRPPQLRQIELKAQKVHVTLDGVDVHVEPGKFGCQVGCHFITWEALEFLLKLRLS